MLEDYQVVPGPRDSKKATVTLRSTKNEHLQAVPKTLLLRLLLLHVLRYMLVETCKASEVWL